MSMCVYVVSRRWLYVLLGGLPCWFGLISAGLHPSLALVFIVPVMPASIDRSTPSPLKRLLGACSPSKVISPSSPQMPQTPTTPPPRVSSSLIDFTRASGGTMAFFSKPPGRPDVLPRRASDANFVTPLANPGAAGGARSAIDDAHEHAHPPLHAFEHDMKMFIDFGMFFFTLCNAGVQVNFIGPLTLTIFAALLAGKVCGLSHHPPSPSTQPYILSSLQHSSTFSELSRNCRPHLSPSPTFPRLR